MCRAPPQSSGETNLTELSFLMKALAGCSNVLCTGYSEDQPSNGGNHETSFVRLEVTVIEFDDSGTFKENAKCTAASKITFYPHHLTRRDEGKK